MTLSSSHNQDTHPDSPDAPPAASTKSRAAVPGWLLWTLRLLVIVSIPPLLVLTSVRLVATEAFLRFEYHRPGFPADRYGFTLADRLEYGPYGVRYLHNNDDISYLGNLEYDGQPLFRAKELQHMEDVKVVSRAAFRVHTVWGLVFVVMIAVLAWQPSGRRCLREAISGGGVLTLSLIITLLVFAFASWDFFFDSFHGIFFEGDSWLFYNSDSLIRLYPEQFWFDAALTIGLLTIGGAMACVGGVWYWEQRQHRQQAIASIQETGAAPGDPQLTYDEPVSGSDDSA